MHPRRNPLPRFLFGSECQDMKSTLSDVLFSGYEADTVAGDELWRTLIPEGQSLAVHASVQPVYMSSADAEESLYSAAIGMYIVRNDDNRHVIISIAGAGEPAAVPLTLTTNHNPSRPCAPRGGEGAAQWVCD